MSDTEYFGQANLATAYGSGTFEGSGDTVCDDDSVIAGGLGNTVDSGDTFDRSVAAMSFIGAGYINTITSDYAFVGAGSYNEVDGRFSFIGAGATNRVPANESFIGAGENNQVLGLDAFIGAGAANTIDSGASYGSIIGGGRNSISGEYASVIGGYGNVANGAYAIVAGGDGDVAAGTVSFAAGYHADAAHNGSFVWSDYSSGSATLRDSAINQFVVRASGGTYVYSNEAATAGVRLAAGSGTWASLSDRNSKTDLAPLDDASVLAKIDALPIGTWRYTSERGVRHAGPMAQDFYAAFGVGEDDRYIASIDEDGIALAAIKALEMQNRQLGRANDRLRVALVGVRSENRRHSLGSDARIALLETRLAAVEARLRR